MQDIKHANPYQVYNNNREDKTYMTDFVVEDLYEALQTLNKAIEHHRRQPGWNSKDTKLKELKAERQKLSACIKELKLNQTASSLDISKYHQTLSETATLLDKYKAPLKDVN